MQSSCRMRHKECASHHGDALVFDINSKAPLPIFHQPSIPTNVAIVWRDLSGCQRFRHIPLCRRRSSSPTHGKQSDEAVRSHIGEPGTVAVQRCPVCKDLRTAFCPSHPARQLCSFCRPRLHHAISIFPFAGRDGAFASRSMGSHREQKYDYAAHGACLEPVGCYTFASSGLGPTRSEGTFAYVEPF